MKLSLCIAGILAAGLVSGCAVQHKALAQYGDYTLEGEILSGASFEHQGLANPGSLPGCVASTISNDSVSLTDATGSFVGGYTGNYYHSNNSREVGGGNVLQYVSDSGSEVVAKGSTQYTSGMVQRSVRFSVRIKDDGEKRSYVFSNLQQAQLSTGYANNTGYNPIHARPGGGAEHVMLSLKQVAASVDACMN